MSILSRSGDLVYSLRFLRILTTPWKKTNAYKLGIIDKDGSRITSKKVRSSEEKSAYNTFHRLVFSIKRILNSIPKERRKLATYTSAFFLIKEHYGVSDDALKKLLEKMGEDLESLSEETQSSWFVSEDEQGPFIPKGRYRLQTEKVLNVSLEPLAKVRDKVVFRENARPVGQVFDRNIYETLHINTNQKVYVIPEEITQ